jgi:hypothetical protein
MKNIPNILRALTNAEVQFVVVGGFAVQLHGFVRSTIDLDLTLAMDDVNLTKFIKVAKQFDLSPVIPASIESLKNPGLINSWFEQKGMVAFALREAQPAGAIIDVLVRPVVTFEDLAAQSLAVELFGGTVKIASIDHLVAMKQAANRPKDLIDIDALQRIKRGEDPNA